MMVVKKKAARITIRGVRMIVNNRDRRCGEMFSLQAEISTDEVASESRVKKWKKYERSSLLIKVGVQLTQARGIGICDMSPVI
jgi:hypothetical protein